jgi:hypothetical protein
LFKNSEEAELQPEASAEQYNFGIGTNGGQSKFSF